MKRIAAILLAVCCLCAPCFAAGGELTLAEKFKASVVPKQSFETLIDGLDFRGEFKRDPQGFLAGLSKQTQKVQKKVVFLLVWSYHHYEGNAPLEELLGAQPDSKETRGVISAVHTEMEREEPDYRELFTRISDFSFADAQGRELWRAFERNPYEFVSRLSVYNVKWQFIVCSLLTSEYRKAENMPALEQSLAALRKDKSKYKTFLFHITLDNITNAYKLQLEQIADANAARGR